MKLPRLGRCAASSRCTCICYMYAAALAAFVHGGQPCLQCLPALLRSQRKLRSTCPQVTQQQVGAQQSAHLAGRSPEPVQQGLSGAVQPRLACQSLQRQPGV